MAAYEISLNSDQVKGLLTSDDALKGSVSKATRIRPFSAIKTIPLWGQFHCPKYDEIYRALHASDQNIAQLAAIHLALHVRQHTHDRLIVPYPLSHFPRSLQLTDITPHAAIRNAQGGNLLLQCTQYSTLTADILIPGSCKCLHMHSTITCRIQVLRWRYPSIATSRHARTKRKPSLLTVVDSSRLISDNPIYSSASSSADVISSNVSPVRAGTSTS